MEWLQQIAKEYGLFTALVAYVLWDSRQREIRYIKVIDTLSDEIKKDLGVLKLKLEEWIK